MIFRVGQIPGYPPGGLRAPARRAAALTRQTIVWALKTEGADTTGGISQPTASVELLPDRYYQLGFACAAASPPGEPTLSNFTVAGTGFLTGANRRLTVFHASGLSSSGILSIASFGETWTSACWILLEGQLVDLAAPLPQAAKVDSATANTGRTNTLPTTFEHVTNWNVTFTAISTQGDITKDANFTEPGAAGGVDIGSGTLSLSAQVAANRASCTPSYASSASCMVSTEVKSRLA